MSCKRSSSNFLLLYDDDEGDVVDNGELTQVESHEEVGHSEVANQKPEHSQLNWDDQGSRSGQHNKEELINNVIMAMRGNWAMLLASVTVWVSKWVRVQFFFTLARRSCSCCRRGRRPRSRCRGGREGTQSRLHIGGSTWGRRRNRNCGCKMVICRPTNQTGRCKAGKVREPGSNRFPPGVGSSWVSQNKVLL